MPDELRAFVEFVSAATLPNQVIMSGLLALAVIAVPLAQAIFRLFRSLFTRKSQITIGQRLNNDARLRNETYENARLSIERDILPKFAKGGVIALEIIHDADWDQFFRDEARRNISFDEVFEGMRRLESAKNVEVILILHTLGGYSLPSIMLADALRKYRSRGGRVTAFVPYVALSGGTILALASDDVWMSDVARLGPIDTQFGSISGDALRQLGDHKSSENQGDATLLARIEAAKYENYYKSELQALVDLDALDKRVYDGSLSHGHAFGQKDAEKFGIRTIPRAKLPDRQKKTAEKFSELARLLVDERLVMMKNSHLKDAVEAEPKAKVPPSITVSRAA